MSPFFVQCSSPPVHFTSVIGLFSMLSARAILIARTAGAKPGNARVPRADTLPPHLHPYPLKLFYGWRIAAAGAGIQFLHSALLVQAFGAYVAVLSEEQGWSKTALAGGAALQSL